jgi:hypothetical protein
MSIIIDGNTVPEGIITVYEPTLNTQVKSATRNANGTLIRETLPNKWSLKIELDFGCDYTSYHTWFNILVALTRYNFSVSFPAPTGVVETATFYLSPVSAKLIDFNKGVTGWWKTISFELVEV